MKRAGVAELVDALDLKSNSGFSLSAGPSPAAGTVAYSRISNLNSNQT